MQVVQIADQVQRVFQVPLLLLALLAQQVGDIHVPQQENVFLLLGNILPRSDELREDRFGAELQRPQQVFQLPEVEDVFGDILAPFVFGDVHCPWRAVPPRYLIQFFGASRWRRKYCCDLSRLRDWSTMFLVSFRIVR